jgi:hypothetical protein
LCKKQEGVSWLCLASKAVPNALTSAGVRLKNESGKGKAGTIFEEPEMLELREASFLRSHYPRQQLMHL